MRNQSAGFVLYSRRPLLAGAVNKGSAVKALHRLLEDSLGPLITVGIGDGLNKAPMLNALVVPVLMTSPQLSELKRLVPRGIITSPSGPEGWRDIIQTVLVADS